VKFPAAGQIPPVTSSASVVLQKIFSPQLVEAKNRVSPQYLVWTEIFCNTTASTATAEEFRKGVSELILLYAAT
jgi:hypothetical protein